MIIYSGVYSEAADRAISDWEGTGLTSHQDLFIVIFTVCLWLGKQKEGEVDDFIHVQDSDFALTRLYL